MHIAIQNLKQVFPDLDIFTFPIARDSKWLRSVCHPSLQTIVLDNHGSDATGFRGVPWGWGCLRGGILAVSLERFSGLRSVTLKLLGGGLCRGLLGTHRSSFGEFASHLRGASGQVEIEWYVRGSYGLATHDSRRG